MPSSAKGPRVTVQAIPTVYIHVCGEPRDFPKCPVDGGLVQRLTSAIGVGTLPLPERVLSSGGGRYEALWRPGDAEEVLAWLEREGVKPR